MAWETVPTGRANEHGAWCSTCQGWCLPGAGRAVRTDDGWRVVHIDCTGMEGAKPPARLVKLRNVEFVADSPPPSLEWTERDTEESAHYGIDPSGAYDGA